MSRWMRRLRDVGLCVPFVIGMCQVAGAQPGGRYLGGNIKYNSGQTVQPIFDGWTKAPDGSYDLHFGYLNRNYVEELSVPVGPDNDIEPGGSDRGQPTYFYTRFNKRAFSVRVPSDWGKKEVVWTLTVRGKSERAVGWLQPEWEIEPTQDGGSGKEPPTIAIAPPSRVTLPASLTLTATVTGDLPPPPRGRQGGTSENPPAFHFAQPTPSAPVNVPQLQRPPRPRITGKPSVTWIVWRGPAGVRFDPPVSAADNGQAVATATFTKAGEYVLRARMSDPRVSTMRDVKVTVDGTSSQPRH